MHSKKIFFVANARSIHTVKWVDYFVEKNYDVYLATFSKINNTKCQQVYFLGTKTSQTSGGNYHYLFSILELSNIFNKVQPDYINAHYSYSMGLVALLAKKRSKIKSEFSVVCHGSDILSPPKPYIFDKINQFVLSHSHKVFAVSDQIKDKVEYFGVNSDNIFVGQYGTELHEKKVPKNIDIISNRAYHENSRIDFLLENLKTVDKNLNIIFIVPNIPDKDYNTLISKYPHITFYKHIEHKKMVELLNRSKIYISATKSDGTALSLLEAMTLNCIPIISNIISNRSWVLDEVNGYLFNNKEDFLSKLSKALTLETANTMVKINIDLMQKKANYKNQMHKIENFLIGNK